MGFVLIQFLVLAVVTFILTTHINRWFRSHFFPQRLSLLTMENARDRLSTLNREIAFMIPWAACIGTSSTNSAHPFDNALVNLRLEASIRLIIGGLALLVTPAFSGFLLHTAGVL